MTAKNDLSAVPTQAVGTDQPELPIGKGGPEKDPRSGQAFAGKQLVLGLLFGLLFGFLLQKGGVAKYHVLIGVLLLEDFTVIKVMLTAILVGMIGVFGLYSLGLVNLHIKPTRYAANILGGLLFGVGFAFFAYCPGTGAAALGQGNFDALAGILGLVVGSYLYAESSGLLGRSVMKWGDRGKLMLPELARMSPVAFILLFAPFLIAVLIFLDWKTVR